MTYKQLFKMCEPNLEVFTKIEDVIAFWEKYKIICNSKVIFLKDMKNELIISFFKFVDVWKKNNNSWYKLWCTKRMVKEMKKDYEKNMKNILDNSNKSDANDNSIFRYPFSGMNLVIN